MKNILDRVCACGIQRRGLYSNQSGSHGLIGLLLALGLGLLILSCGSGGASGSGNGDRTSCADNIDVRVADGDCDGDGVANGMDDFDRDASKSCDIVFSGDGANHESDRLDCDNDNVTNDRDNCPAVANAGQLNSDSAHPTQQDALGDACDLDDDGDLVNDDVDVDDDNDGLIELYDGAMLNNMRHNADGSSYKTSASDSDMGDITGMPTTKPPACTDFETNLCGYELGASFAFPGDWVPLPDRGEDGSFGGVFEGNGYSLTNLNYTSTGEFHVGGLFDEISAVAAVVRNLRVTGRLQFTSMKDDSNFGLGGVIGRTIAGTFIAISSGVAVTGDAERSVGGLFGLSGSNGDNISSNSFADGPVTGSGSLGGLIGAAVGGSVTIADSYATGAVTGSAAGGEGIGGLVGHSNFTGEITTSYASGNVDGRAGDGDMVGGLVGLRAAFPPPSASTSPSMKSYHSGTIAPDSGSATNDGTPQSDTQLRGCGADGSKLAGAEAALVCTGLYTGWSATDWDFGTAEQLPALKYDQHETTTDDDCSPVPGGMTLAELPFRPGPIAQPYCGKLLPEQRR